VLTTEGADWESQRRLLTPAFSPKRMSGYMALMQAAIDHCVREELPADPGQSASIDVDAFTTRITMDVILRTLFPMRARARKPARPRWRSARSPARACARSTGR
jgi:cytochrome P450